MRLRCLLICLALVSAFTAALNAQQNSSAAVTALEIGKSAAKSDSDPAAAAALDKARELSNLHGAGTSPFRLQASFETYDYKGAPDGKGIMTEVYLREGYWQRSILYRDKHSKITTVDGKTRTTSDPDYQTTLPMGHVIDDLFGPIPSQDRLKGYSITMSTVKNSVASLNCVVASLPYVDSSSAANLDFHPGMLYSRNEITKATIAAPNGAYCLDKDPQIIRMVEGHHGLIFTFNRILRFGSVYIPGDITMMENGKMRAHLHVDAIIANHELSEEDIVLPTEDTGGAQYVPGAVIAGQKKNRVPLYYPEMAKKKRIQGTVVLHALIGKDGHIRDLELISTPDDYLADAAMDVVRQWTYTPYLLNGAPAEVDTTINATYMMR